MADKTSPELVIADRYYLIQSKKNGIVEDTVNRQDIAYTDSIQTYTTNPKQWRKLLRQGVGVTTTRTGKDTTIKLKQAHMECMVKFNPFLPESDPGYDEYKYKLTGGIIAGYSVPGLRSLTDLVFADDRAQANFLKSARRALSSLQGGVLVAEMGKTIRGLKNPAEAFTRYLSDHARAAKRLRKRGQDAKHSQRRISRAVSNLWLEKAYHWVPLAADLEGAVKAVRLLYNQVETKRIFSIGNDEQTEDGPLTTQVWGPFVIHYRNRYKEQRTVKYYGTVSAVPGQDISSFQELARVRLGLTLSDIAPTLWELIPFSFVADYFSNVGDMISAYSFPSANIKWMNRGIVLKYTNESSDIQVNRRVNTFSETYEYGFVDPGTFTAEVKEWTRTPFEPKDLIPSFRLEIPGIGDWPKWLNLAALSRVLSD